MLNEISEIASTAKKLVSILSHNPDPMSPSLLWAEWHFYKALHAYYLNDETWGQFLIACDNLNVDENGNSNDAVYNEDGTCWGDVN